MAITEDLYGQQRALTNRVFANANGASGEEAISRWAAGHEAALERANGLISEFRSAGGLDVARLAIINRHIRNLIVE